MIEARQNTILINEDYKMKSRKESEEERLNPIDIGEQEGRDAVPSQKQCKIEVQRVIKQLLKGKIIRGSCG